jgi:16S rRNA processing protein RimM
LVVGRIVRPHGVNGLALLQSFTDSPDRFKRGSRLGLGDPNAATRPLTVTEVRESGDRLLVRFKELPRLEDVESARGGLLSIPTSEAAPPPEGAYYPYQLEGLAVVDETGRSMGTLARVLSAPANDVWVVDVQGREVLVPAVDEIIIRVDLDARAVIVRSVTGMFE